MTTSADLVLLIGAPRSGTTWLQQLLGAHALVATPQETDLFSRFLQPLHDSWRRETRDGQAGLEERRFKGLHSVLTESDFIAIGSEILDRVMLNATRLKPGSEIVVEKTPAHSLCSSSIALFAPSAKIVHLIRDGRDVASSLVEAGNGWGAWWAPKSVTRASEVWIEFVEGARECAGSGSYLEVRYEDLHANGALTLGRVFSHIGIEANLQDCELLVESFALDKMTAGETSIVIGGDFARVASQRTEPVGFFGKGGSGSWREQWSAKELLAFDRVGGDLLMELGYEESHNWAGTSSQIASFKRQCLKSERSQLRVNRLVAGLNKLRRKHP